MNDVCENGHIVKKRRKRDGKCWTCAMTEHMRQFRIRNPKVYTEEDRVTDRKNRKRIRGQLKRDIIATFGGKCECCGETEFAFLCLDHIKGGGRKHRKSIGSSHQFWYWMKRQIAAVELKVLKKDFRILCSNCNHAMGVYGRCPHKKGRK